MNTEKVSVFTPEERQKRIKKEHSRLKKIFSAIDPQRLKAVEGLIEHAAHMRVALLESEILLDRVGLIERYQNGVAQTGVKKSSAFEAYDKLTSNYAKVIKQLCDLLPEGVSKNDPAEELYRFTAGIQTR